MAYRILHAHFFDGSSFSQFLDRWTSQMPQNERIDHRKATQAVALNLLKSSNLAQKEILLLFLIDEINALLSQKNGHEKVKQAASPFQGEEVLR